MEHLFENLEKLNTMRQRRVIRKPIRNMITFGTSFFIELLDQIQLEMKGFANIGLDFSCYGEGEQKIVDRLKCLNLEEKTTIIYSNDSDLINLVLMNISLERNFIYQINPTSLPLILSQSSGKITLHAVHINQLKVANDFGSNSNFVFLCQLMGTDYNQPVTDNDILHLFYSKIQTDFFCDGRFHVKGW